VTALDVDRRLIGIAAVVPDPARTELQELREKAGDPDAGRVPPHVTFVPPLSVAVADLPAVHSRLDAVAAAHQPFELRLAGPGTFAPVSAVVFAQVSAGISQCEQLEADLCVGVLDHASTFPYHPHVTVAHDVGQAELDSAYSALMGYQARFDIDRFVMFEQEPDGAWRPRRAFRLGPAGR